MSDYWDYLLEEVKTPSRWIPSSKIRYRGGKVDVPIPRITTTPFGKTEKLTLGEELIRRIQLGEDPDVVYKELLNRKLSNQELLLLHFLQKS